MITTWIREDFDGACWRRLLEVVAASYGGQNPALAKALAKEHTISEGEACVHHSTKPIKTLLHTALYNGLRGFLGMLSVCKSVQIRK